MEDWSSECANIHNNGMTDMKNGSLYDTVNILVHIHLPVLLYFIGPVLCSFV